MDKHLFKFFYTGKIVPVLVLALALILAHGCTLNPNSIGHLESNAPNETAQDLMVYFCPKDDCGKVLEGHILSANQSVYCAFYDMNLKNVMNSLSKKSKIVDTRLVMDRSNAKGVARGNVRLGGNGQLMHNKFCAIDGKIVLTGSFNPTDNDNYRNNNNMVVINSRFLAKNYEEEFMEMWNGDFGKGKKSPYRNFHINGIDIENYFCPEECSMQYPLMNKDGALSRILELIGDAKISVMVASYTFSNKKIADELVKAHTLGINVTIITESRQRNVQGSQYMRLKDIGIKILLDGNKYNMHHKFIVIDGKIIVIGSPNFTLSGFDKNDENMLIIFDEKMASKYAEEFNMLRESAAVKEIKNEKSN